MAKKLTTNEFKIKANKIHDNYYNYSKVEYANAHTKITIICPTHGKFSQTPASHLMGRGCQLCGRERTINVHKKSQSEFLKQANKIHNSRYDYSKVKFINLNTKVKITCPEHGVFEQKPIKHLMGQGCRKCIKYKLREFFQLSKDTFVKKSKERHGSKYNYSEVKYINAHTKIIIICPIHGRFNQEPNSHMRGNGCPSCAYSNKSYKATKWLSNFNIEVEQVIRINNKRYIVDGFDKNNNVIYEYYGDFWHGNPKVFDLDNYNIKCGVKFVDLFNATIKRAKEIVNDGYDLVYKWETDYDMGVGKKYRE